MLWNYSSLMGAGQFERRPLIPRIILAVAILAGSVESAWDIEMYDMLKAVNEVRALNGMRSVCGNE